MIDQFEELFDHARHHGPEEAGLLTAFCTALFRDPPDGLNLILTMRSEFLGSCARFDDFALTVNATQYLLPRMQHEDLLRAIREPARLYDGEVSRPLAERLVADAGGGQDELPLIQHGLMLLHRTHGGSGGPWRLGLEHYGERGLKALLSDHADAVMADVERALPATPASSRLVEDLLRALTDINADGQAIRRPRTFRQLVAATGADEATVRQVLDGFRAEGVSFLRPYGSEPIEPDDRVDISHEALIRRWFRVADPKDGWLIREFRNGLVWRALLVQSESFERDPSNVLSPTTTDEREKWLERRTAAWAERYGGGWDRVQKLVAASASARDRQREDEAAVRKREEEARLQRQRSRYVYGGGAVLVVLLLLLTFFAVRASREAITAGHALADARLELAKADGARATSEKLAAEAEVARVRSEALAAETLRSASTLQEAIAELRTPSSATAQTTRAAALRRIEAVVKTLETSDPKTAAAAPVAGARVYVHITSEEYRNAALAFERALEAATIDGAKIVVPGIELVKSAPASPALRCFQRDECQGEAEKVRAVANNLLANPQLELQDLSARYGGTANVRPRHYEIWFTGGLTLRQQAKPKS